MADITQCDGYKSLRAAVDKDYAKDRYYQKGGRPFHDYQAKFDWTVERAKHYGDALGMDPADVLNAWEKGRDYWYMNYYQDANQPKIDADHVRVFDTVAQLKESIGSPRFRCPACGGISSDAYTCDSGIEREGKPCDWKAYGLFGALGKGTFVYVKEKLAVQSIFMPVAWEDDAAAQPA
ncbi:hypothetical protein DEM26_18010 [Thioclava sp. NG1]|uniref:hypothetical protein n=1 Tax=Thioclava sp. NG1 TaxID=2182426 RepID=UPI000D604544|nr:hypothetical protein [Thioclava sp. NG1]PWE48443.1 hypothetical protein DEM26_18010 [Thioclava sp. NG1]